MPVTSFALWVAMAVFATVVMFWAFSNWGLAVVPVLILLVLAGRWALSPVPYDDGHT